MLDFVLSNLGKRYLNGEDKVAYFVGMKSTHTIFRPNPMRAYTAPAHHRYCLSTQRQVLFTVRPPKVVSFNNSGARSNLTGLAHHLENVCHSFASSLNSALLSRTK